MPFLDTYGNALGDRVRIAPTDYHADPVEGQLAISARNEFVLLRTDRSVEEVIAHFSHGLSSNHRFMTSQAEYQKMIAQGWSGEGARFCSPR